MDYCGTKAEMMELDRNGEFPMGYVNCPTFHDAIVILVADDEYVFGYYQYMDNPKEYFRRKTRYTYAEESRPYFLLNGRRYLDEFLVQHL